MDTTIAELFSIELPENDANAETVGEYIKALAFQVLVEEEGFSGKRPFGNSGWISELTIPISEYYGISEDEANELLVEYVSKWTVL